VTNQSPPDKKDAARFEVYRTRVAASWIDYNDHMTEGFYAVAFGNATDAYLNHAGFDADYREKERGTFYTVETRIRYRRELKADASLLVQTTVLGVDQKRLHLFHVMMHESLGFEAASQESLLLHVDVDDVAVRPMAARLLKTMQGHALAHSAVPPPRIGEGIRHVFGEPR